MTVVSEGPLCLKIHLNKYELKKYFTCYSNIHFNDPQVKKTISFLFDIAVEKTEFETSGKRVIEVFPSASGGCILKFTSEPMPTAVEKQSQNIRLRLNKENSLPYIFTFSSFEDILKVIKLLNHGQNTKNYCCDLFTNNKKYFVSIVIPLFDRKTPIILNEFSDYSAKGKYALPLLTEYAKCLIKATAIPDLSRAFFKEPLSP